MKERIGFELEINQLINSNEYLIQKSAFNEVFDLDTLKNFEVPYHILSKRLNYTNLAQKLNAEFTKLPRDKIEIYLALQRLERNSIAISNLINEYKKKYKVSIISAIKNNLFGSEGEFAIQLLNKGTKGALEEIKPIFKDTNMKNYRNTAAIRLNNEFSKSTNKINPEIIFAILIPFERKPQSIWLLETQVYSQKYSLFFRDSILRLDEKNKNYGLYLLGEQPILNMDSNALNSTNNILKDLSLKAYGNRNNVFKKSVSKTSRFYKSLTKKYLKDYFSKSNKNSGSDAKNKIGKEMKTQVNKSTIEVSIDGGKWRKYKGHWERGAHDIWNKLEIPPISPKLQNSMLENLKKLRSNLRGNIPAATDILRDENLKDLKILDVPFLLGKDNPGTDSFDKDILEGGKNVSQLMHWATGVKYSDQSKDGLREIFLLYELWKLEGWDVFTQDSINDMIAEEQGRILGVELLKESAGKLKSEKDLISFLNDSFIESRAWVGALLHLRLSELNSWVISKEQKRGSYHWTDDLNFQWHFWDSLTIYQMFADGLTYAEVENSEFVKNITEIYSLIYESEEWINKYGQINITKFQSVLIQGSFNLLLRFEIQKDPKEKSKRPYKPINPTDVLEAVKQFNNL